MGTSGVIRTILIVDIVALALLALIYLRQRKMDWVSYCCWGLLALFVPVLGPFIVIANRPGEWDTSYTIMSDLRRIGTLFKRMLPGAVPARKLGTLEKARKRRERKRQKP